MINQLEIVNKLKSAERVAIISHIYPDGDAVGSSLALYKALKSEGKTVDMFLCDGVPLIYSFLANTSEVRKIHNQEKYDVAVILDSGDIGRIGSCSSILNYSEFSINIDHHSTGTNFADINLVEPQASSTGEIIYRLIRMSGLDIDKEMAECLYVAISTDTGGFRYSNTTGIAMQVAADLINCGIDVSEISRRIFDVVSLSKVKLMGEAINSLEVYKGRIALMYINNSRISEIKAAPEDFDGIVNIARNIDGIEAAAFLVENEPQKIKVNLRSNNSSVDVAKIAQLFSGGGHKRAAGCKFEGVSLIDAKALISNELLKEFH